MHACIKLSKASKVAFLFFFQFKKTDPPLVSVTTRMELNNHRCCSTFSPSPCSPQHALLVAHLRSMEPLEELSLLRQDILVRTEALAGRLNDLEKSILAHHSEKTHARYALSSAFSDIN